METHEAFSAAAFRHRPFWALFRMRHAAEQARQVRSGPWFWQRLVPEIGLVVTMFVAPRRGLVGVFYGDNRRVGASSDKWKPYQLEIEAALGGLSDEQRWAPGSLCAVWQVNVFAENNWPAMTDWMVAEADRFERAALAVLTRPASQQ